MRFFILSCLGLFGIAVGFFMQNSGYLRITLAENDHCPKDLHYSYFSSKSFFDDGYKDAVPSPIKNSSEVKGIIVNHHLLAPQLIAQTMNTIATDSPVTVLLISPNHFHTGKGQIISSVYGFETPYGTLKSDCDAISLLQQKNILNIDESPFDNEHGVTGIVPFIKKSLPNAKIIPVIVKDTLDEEALNNFVRTTYEILGDTIIVVGSFDFSHYLPDTAAQFHDVKSLSVIRNFDYEAMKTIDTDSVPGLEIVLKYLEREGAKHFDLIAHTNSAEILHDSSIDGTTSYINGTFSNGEKVVDNTATILAFGDMMLDRNVRKQINANGAEYPFEKIKRFLIGSDIVVANSEGSFTSNQSVTLDVKNGPLTFTFDPETLSTIKKIGFTLFSEANNHSFNFGQDGLDESEKYLESIGIDFFGDPLNKNLHSYITTINGQKIAFVGYHEFAYSGYENVIQEIKSLKEQKAFVIVYPHWGIEYNEGMSQGQITKAHDFIDAGADLILGAHPHVIEPIEIYKNKAIFYSLGNFIFDQSSVGPTGKGLAVGITLTDEKISYYLFPFNIYLQQASLMANKDRVKILSSLADSSESEFIKEGIKKGIINLKR